jgi:sirohydrochlorin cobaltochelatase
LEAAQVSEFSDSALVLIGHGSTVNAESAESVRQHASVLRSRNVFREVHEIFWKETPKFEDAAKLTNASRVFFVPMFISEGYFSERAIPSALGFRSGNEQEWKRRRTVERCGLFYCKPVGTHPGMTQVILERAKQVLDQFPFPRRPKELDTSLFIAGHGTEKDASSRKAIDAQTNLIGSLGLYAQVESVFIEEDPRISACVDLARAKNIIVVPLFMSEGTHTQEDLPVMLGTPARVVKERLARGQTPWRNPTERKEKLVWYSSCVGTHPNLTDIVIARVREAAAWASPIY